MARRTILAAVLVVSLFGVAGALAAPDKATVTGEVIDSACYIKMGARGADHAECAKKCGMAGIPLAILADDGKVVWLASTKDMEGANALVQEHVAKRVTVEGTWYEKGGAKILAVEKVTPTK